MTWQEHKELNVFLPSYGSPTVWADMRETEKRFRHNARAFKTTLVKAAKYVVWNSAEHKLLTKHDNDVMTTAFVQMSAEGN